MPTARVSTVARRVSTRRRRTSHRQGPRAPMALVERMVAAASLVVVAYTDRLMRALEPLLQARYGLKRDSLGDHRRDSLRQDAAPSLDDVFEQVREGELSRAFLERMFHMVDHQAANDLQRVVPVPLSDVLPDAARMQAAWVEKNTELIRLEERARQEVRAIIEAPIAEGVRVEEIRARIQERMGVVQSRAELIARDQTLKVYGQIQEARQTDAGIEEYTWSTSDDERVRKRHVELEGTTQRWDSPPIVDMKTGRRAHPGLDFSCRCAAIPVLPTGEEAPISETRPSVRPANDVPPPPEERALAGPLPPRRPAEPSVPTQAAPPPQLPPPAAPPPPPSRPPPSGPPGSGPPSSRLLTTSGDYAAHLATRGIDLGTGAEATFAEARALMGNVSPKELDAIVGWDALGAIPGKRTAHMSAIGGRVQFEVIIERADDPVQLTRTFHKERGKLVVHHDLLSLPEVLQGAGIGKRLIAAQVAAYERIGVSRIDLDAAWIGRYYWPKLGFNCPPAALKRYSAAFVVFLQKAGFEAEAVGHMTKGIKTLRDLATKIAGERQVGKEFLLSHSPLIPALKMSMRRGSKQLAIMKRELGL